MENIWETIKEQKVIVLSALATLIVAIGIGIVIWSTTAVDKMRLVQIEGSVLLGHGGEEGTVMSVGKLVDGDELYTGEDGWAQIALDDTKLVSLEASSRVTLNQDGPKYELHLTEGDLFFNVSKYLEGNESLKVYLPTMVLEIRGTSGYVSVDTTGQEWLYLCDGKVHLTATNPLTGEVASKDVYEGHKVSVRYYEEQTEERGSVEFVVENMSEQDLPHPLIRELALDKVLLRRVVIATGFSEEQLVKMAQQLENGEPLEESEEETIEEETLEEEEPEDEEVEEEEQEEEETPEEDTRQTTTRRQRTQQAQEQPQENQPNNIPASQPAQQQNNTPAPQPNNTPASQPAQQQNSTPAPGQDNTPADQSTNQPNNDTPADAQSTGAGGSTSQENQSAPQPDNNTPANQPADQPNNTPTDDSSTGSNDSTQQGQPDNPPVADQPDNSTPTDDSSTAPGEAGGDGN